MGAAPVPQALAVVDGVVAPGLADVGALQPVQLPVRHLPESGPAQHDAELVQRGTARQLEVAYEAGGETLRVEGVEGDGVVVQQVAAEVFARSTHSSSFFPV